MDKLLLSLTEFCQVTGIGPTLGKKLVREGAVESVKIGDRRLIPASAATEYVERLRAEAREERAAAA
jgi:excisionase family DNA binding protein